MHTLKPEKEIKSNLIRATETANYIPFFIKQRRQILLTNWKWRWNTAKTFFSIKKYVCGYATTIELLEQMNELESIKWMMIQKSAIDNSVNKSHLCLIICSVFGWFCGISTNEIILIDYNRVKVAFNGYEFNVCLWIAKVTWVLYKLKFSRGNKSRKFWKNSSARENTHTHTQNDGKDWWNEYLWKFTGCKVGR